jgi:hypothetical protein
MPVIDRIKVYRESNALFDDLKLNHASAGEKVGDEHLPRPVDSAEDAARDADSVRVVAGELLMTRLQEVATGCRDWFETGRLDNPTVDAQMRWIIINDEDGRFLHRLKIRFTLEW